jgi:hypothetical protein
MADGTVALLRPIERCVVRMTEAGVSDSEIGRRLHRSADHVRRVRDLTTVARTAIQSKTAHHDLRPLERRVLRWLDDGVDHEYINEVFRRGSGFAELVEEMARYKLTR